MKRLTCTRFHHLVASSVTVRASQQMVTLGDARAVLASAVARPARGACPPTRAISETPHDRRPEPRRARRRRRRHGRGRQRGHRLPQARGRARARVRRAVRERGVARAAARGRGPGLRLVVAAHRRGEPRAAGGHLGPGVRRRQRPDVLGRAGPGGDALPAARARGPERRRGDGHLPVAGDGARRDRVPRLPRGHRHERGQPAGLRGRRREGGSLRRVAVDACSARLSTATRRSRCGRRRLSTRRAWESTSAARAGSSRSRSPATTSSTASGRGASSAGRWASRCR